jgi:hypothetical protein
MSSGVPAGFPNDGVGHIANFDEMVAAALTGGTVDYVALKKQITFEKSSYTRFWDFDNGIAGTPFSATVLNSATVAGGQTATGRFGIVQLSTVTNAAGAACMKTDNFMYLGAGTFDLQMLGIINNLSTVAEEYIFAAGFIDTTNADSTNGVYFYYDRLNKGVNWFLRVVDATSVVDHDLGIAATTNYRNFRLLITPTSIYAYIANTLLKEVTTGIPTTASKPLGIGAWIKKSAGTTARTANFDYVQTDFVMTDVPA